MKQKLKKSLNFQEKRDFSRFWLGKARKATKGSKSFIFVSVFGGNFAVFLVFLLFRTKSGKITFFLIFFLSFFHFFSHIFQMFFSFFQMFFSVFSFFSRHVFKSKRTEINQKKKTQIRYFHDLALWLRWIFTNLANRCWIHDIDTQSFTPVSASWALSSWFSWLCDMISTACWQTASPWS